MQQQKSTTDNYVLPFVLERKGEKNMVKMQ